MRFYSQHGESISDALGNRIETGAAWPFTPKPVQVARPGDVIPDYTLFPPDGLNVAGRPLTVDTPTRLSDLVSEGGGSFEWAACRDVF